MRNYSGSAELFGAGGRGRVGDQRVRTDRGFVMRGRSLALADGTSRAPVFALPFDCFLAVLAVARLFDGVEAVRGERVDWVFSVNGLAVSASAMSRRNSAKTSSV